MLSGQSNVSWLYKKKMEFLIEFLNSCILNSSKMICMYQIEYDSFYMASSIKKTLTLSPVITRAGPSAPRNVQLLTMPWFTWHSWLRVCNDFILFLVSCLIIISCCPKGLWGRECQGFCILAYTFMPHTPVLLLINRLDVITAEINSTLRFVVIVAKLSFCSSFHSSTIKLSVFYS